MLLQLVYSINDQVPKYSGDCYQCQNLRDKMKKILCFLFTIMAASAFAITPIKEKIPVKRMMPDSKMAGYADWDSWVFMSESTSGSKYYIKRSIRIPDGIDFWVKVEEQKIPDCFTGLQSHMNPFLETPSAIAHRKAERLSCERERKEAVGSTIMHLIFSCNTRRAKYLEMAGYNQLGEPIETRRGKEEWVAVIPDTVIDSLMTKMCANEN